MKESMWTECLETGSSMTVSPDREKAKSLLDTAMGRNAYLRENALKESNASYIFEGYYSSILELLHARLRDGEGDHPEVHKIYGGLGKHTEEQAEVGQLVIIS